LYIEDKPTAAPVPSINPATEEKRRWGLTILIVVVAAGAAAARAARHR
jgi:hypothetical protein